MFTNSVGSGPFEGSNLLRANAQMCERVGIALLSLNPRRPLMWVPSVGVFELILRGIVVYLVLFALLRFIGKKHVGELSPFDLVVLLIIS
jgi:hypothetical protein